MADQQRAPHQAPDQIVVVGSSAGGIEALSTLVSTLPTDLPAPVVIAQHLDPQRPSHLPEILARRSALPVHAVTRQETLAAGHIYVISPDHHIEMRDGHLMVRRMAGSRSDEEQRPAQAGWRPSPSINALFRSAANAFGDGVIAVVLSGTGSDGAAGALEVKKAGGTVVIQNPQTASYPAMPLSLAPTAVDLVANVEEIGPLLQGLLTGTAALEPTDADKALHTLLAQVRAQTSLDFAGYRTPTILRRITRRMAATGCSSLETYRLYLQQHPEEYPRLVSTFLIKVTEFFRDPPIFAALRTDVLPAVIAYAREHDKHVRIWSAGCATGEEAYSVAILLAELLGSELEQFTVRIFATDLDRDAIAFARRGRYPATALADVPPELVSRHFTAVDDDYEVSKVIRGLVIFGEHNLLERAPFPHIDLVLCRNVLMYLTTELQKRVLQVFAYSLRNDGYLVLGKAETAHPLPHYFAPVQQVLRIYRRHGDHVAIPVRQFIEALPLSPKVYTSSTAVREIPEIAGATGTTGTAGTSPDVPVVPGAPVTAAGTPRLISPQPRSRFAPPPHEPRERTRRATATERLGALMLDLPIGVVIVDRKYDIQNINTVALRLLGIHREPFGEDILHLCRGVSIEALREIIDTALSSSGVEPLPPQTIPAMLETGEKHFLQITGYSHSMVEEAAKQASGKGIVDSVLLLVSDVTASVKERAAAEQARTQSAQASSRDETAANARMETKIAELTDQVHRLMIVNQELRDANQVYAQSILDLREENQEFQIDAEEMQAASEEVETLNEELQATNEELETVNEELQATVEELHTANDDMEARSRELVESAATQERQRLESERERARLAAILSGIGDAVLVVDATGRVLLTNPTYDRWFGSGDELGGGTPEDTGRRGETDTAGAPGQVPGEQFQPGQLCDEQGQPLPPAATPRQRAMRGEAFSMIFTRIDAVGKQFWYEANGQPLPASVGVHASGIVVIRDISDRSLRQLQEQFLSLASHELRSPLTGLLMALQLIERRLPPPEQDSTNLRLHVHTAMSAARMMDVLVTDLVDAARLRTNKLRLDLKPTDLVPLVRTTVERVQLLAPEGQQLALAVEAPSLVVQGDTVRLQQVLANLLANAITYAPNTARIDVRLRLAEHNANAAELQVQDYGPGIPAEDLPQIFSLFYQVARRERGEPQSSAGLGLGLYITKALVDAHNGEITVATTLGQGTTFTIRLPLVSVIEHPASSQSEGEAEGGQ